MSTRDGLTDENRKQIYEYRRRNFYKTHCALCQQEHDRIQKTWCAKHGKNSIPTYKRILYINDVTICPDCEERCKQGAPTEYDKTIEEICILFGRTYPTRCDNGRYWVFSSIPPRDFRFPEPHVMPSDNIIIPKDPDHFDD